MTITQKQLEAMSALVAKKKRILKFVSCLENYDIGIVIQHGSGVVVLDEQRTEFLLTYTNGNIKKMIEEEMRSAVEKIDLDLRGLGMWVN